VPLVPRVPDVPDVPDVPAVPELLTPPTVLVPIRFVDALYTNTTDVDGSASILSNFKLPEINALPVNCPLSVPCNVDRLDTDAETAPNELDIFSNSVRLASISTAVIGEPFVSLLVIAILYYTCKFHFIIQVNINI
jgi:hypothetical protein